MTPAAESPPPQWMIECTESYWQPTIEFCRRMGRPNDHAEEKQAMIDCIARHAPTDSREKRLEAALNKAAQALHSTIVQLKHTDVMRDLGCMQQPTMNPEVIAQSEQVLAIADAALRPGE